MEFRIPYSLFPIPYPIPSGWHLARSRSRGGPASDVSGIAFALGFHDSDNRRGRYRAGGTLRRSPGGRPNLANPYE